VTQWQLGMSMQRCHIFNWKCKTVICVSWLEGLPCLFMNINDVWPFGCRREHKVMYFLCFISLPHHTIYDVFSFIMENLPFNSTVSSLCFLSTIKYAFMLSSSVDQKHLSNNAIFLQCILVFFILFTHVLSIF